VGDLNQSQKYGLFDRVVSILEHARVAAVRTINTQMTVAYWLIGREIVEEEQRGERRAAYGAQLIDDLSKSLTDRYGRGFSVPNLRNFRQFYLSYPDRLPAPPSGVGAADLEKRYTLCSESWEETIAAASESASLEKRQCYGFAPELSWSHYRLLMRVENRQARSFYEIEAARSRWSVRQLSRQINSLLFERLAASRDREGVLRLANEGQVVETPVDAIKDPYVLEFLDLPESPDLAESGLEKALINHLQQFLLELGSGFAFVSRQGRLTLDGDHFYPDLVFYHIKLKCYVIIDLKVARLTHEDLGQMLMYVHYYDREVCTAEDAPTLGLILCTDKNDAVVRYVLDEQNETIFASRYKLYLPTEDELRQELERERRLLESHKEAGDG
jgi:predicted nuclease of restriction endonuclease-like (RecB) superfamily